MINKKAKFEYQLLDELEAGLMLSGNEVKSVVENKISFSDSYCYFKNGELFLKNFYIKRSVLDSDTLNETRDRKLLLTRVQLRKWRKDVEREGLTIIPTEIFRSPSGKYKLKISLAKGKKNYDKRETIKERDFKRNLDRNFQ